MHLRQLPSGNWQWIVKVNLATRRGTEATRQKAKAAASEAEVELGRIPKSGTVRFGELLETHLTDHGFAPTLLVDLRRIVDRLGDDVKDWRCRDVEPLQIRALYKRLAADGWKPNTLRRLHMLCSSAYAAALDLGMVSSNPFKVARAPKVDKANVHAPSVDEVKAVLAKFERDSTVATFLRLSATTGMRRGEVCALQWQDIDLDSGTIVVRRSVSHVPGYPEPVVSDTKTGHKGHRVIGIDPTSTAMLVALKAKQDAAVSGVPGRPAPVWVFSHNAGVSPWRGDYISREFREARKAAKIERVRLHDLRHHVATQMLASGDPVTVVSKRLGHASPVTTLGVYAHHVPAADRVAADRLGSALD